MGGDFYLIERQCDACGAGMVLHGPFTSYEEAVAHVGQWPEMICIDRRVVQLGVVSERP